MEKKQIKEFKIKMAEWIYDLSICFSPEAKEMPKEQIKTMVEMIMRIIQANKMTLDLKPYGDTIRLIASGEIEIYKLNIINLMKAFTKQIGERYTPEPYKPDKW
jgi:hypothetical protein